MSYNNHHFHLVNFSPWPLTSALGTLLLLISFIKLFNQSMNQFNTNIGILIILLTMFQWWRDILRESTYLGLHTKKVLTGLKWGMMLFITSEIFFFISFFWTFFHSSLSPTLELGMIWPPMSIFGFDPFKIPLLNTIILLSSGISVTWTHYSILISNQSQSYYSLMLTILLGMYFSFMQMFEYFQAEFSISESIYGATFFVATGFHGIHVLIGTFFLMICLIRHNLNHFSCYHHFGFESAAWYWHFVDIVWLFLFLSIYWWGK